MWDSNAYRNGRCHAGLKHAACRSLYDYWDNLRDGRLAPLRNEIEPADLGRILSDTFVLEAVDGATFLYRLAGTRVGSCFGRELKGENWLDVWSPQDREALTTLLGTIVRDGAGAAIEFTGRSVRGQSATFETLLLPLKTPETGFTRVLGATLPLDEPYWLGAYPIAELRIAGLRLIWAREAAFTGYDDGPRHQPLLPLRRHKHLAIYEGGISD